MTVSSAAGILALLSEDDPTLLHYALQQLDSSLVNSFWAEISDYLSSIEVIYENADLPQETRQLAALLASKVYYHLESLDDALTFALSAGELFKVESESLQEPSNGDQDYTETIVATCIDKYVENRIAQEEGILPSSSSAASTSTGKQAATSNGDTGLASPEDLDKMQAIVERMFARCVKDKEFKQAVGIALDARRLDVIERIFNETQDNSILTYVLEAAMTIVLKLDFRNRVLRLLVQLFSSLKSPDHFSMVQCFVHLNDPSLASEVIAKLVSSTSLKDNPDNKLKAYQIAFDLADTASQEFLGIVSSGLGSPASSTNGHAEAMDTDETQTLLSSVSDSTSGDIPADVHQKLQVILSGRETIALQLEFLYSHAKADLQILTKTKDALEARNSINHSALTFNNAFMNAGTCSDKFLRDNLDWLAKASNWSKFSATAALGVIHRGNLEYGYSLLQPYLPAAGGGSSGGPGASVYSEGGALYALGLVHANNGAAGGKAKESLQFLRTCLKAEGGEVVQHGAALGLGVAAMATGNEEIYDELRDILFLDSAVAGEAAGYAMGLVMLGTASSKALDEMLQYAHETQHEKIIRGLAVGISLLMYGKQEEADSLIDNLMAEQDPILRYGGIHTIAMAYAGTGANSAIRRLLHVAVSDVNDDVRRAAVTSLGFILFRSPAQVPRVVQLLSESYNPHVRYGATLALGISCAGTGLREAIDILEPLTKDPVDFVRQGSCIALAMILIQQNATLNPKSEDARKLFEKIIGDKHEDPMAKFGASVAQGMIDAGGRNVTISLMSRNGNMSLPAIVGLALFTQFWYWFPMAHAAVLAFSPTAVIGVDSELKLPKFDLTSNVRPSIFAYVPELKEPEKDKPEMVKTAVLSMTAKANSRQREKEKEKAAAEGGSDAMDTDDKDKDATAASTDNKDEDSDMKVDGADAESKANGEKKAVAPEPSSQTLPNISRVVPAQMPYISFPPSSRFVPVRPLVSSSAASIQPTKASASPALILEAIVEAGVGLGAGGGILVLKDTKAGETVEYVDLEAKKALAAAAGPEEIQVPQGQQGGAAQQPAQAAPSADLTAPIAPMPEPFQYDGFED